MATDKSKDPDSPLSTTYAYDTMVPRWALACALMGGTETMRAAGAQYLPRHPEETDEAYNCRLEVAVLKNVYEETLNELSTKPFAEDVEIGDDVPEKIVPYLNNVDLMGNELAVFLRDWFQLGLAKGFVHVLVDMPRLDPNPDGTARTLADDRAAVVRPYFVLIQPENVLHMEETIIDGRPVLTYLRMVEYNTVRVGFTETIEKSVKEIMPGLVNIYKPIKSNVATGEVKWYRADTYPTGLQELTVVTFYATRREALMEAKPPLQDLAYMNVAHWQSSSEQQHALTTTRFPILTCEGDPDDSKPIVIGPDQVLYGRKGANFKYLEHTGAAIAVGREDLNKLEEQMSTYGADFLTEQPGDITATAKAIDSAEANSALASIVGKFEDAVAQALGYMALLAGVATTNEDGTNNGGTIELVKSYTPDLADQPGLTALQAARTNKDLSREAFIEGLILRGVLPSDFDLEENDRQLEEESQKAIEQGLAMGVNLDPGATPPPPPAPIGTPKPSPAPKPAGKKAKAAE